MGDFLWFSVNATQHLFPENCYESDKADTYWRPLTWSVPLVLLWLIFMFAGAAYFFHVGIWWVAQSCPKALRKFLIITIKLFTWSGEKMTSVSKEDKILPQPCSLPSLSMVFPIGSPCWHSLSCLASGPSYYAESKMLDYRIDSMRKLIYHLVDTWWVNIKGKF